MKRLAETILLTPLRRILAQAVLWMVVSFLATGTVIVALLVVNDRHALSMTRPAIDLAGGLAGEALLLIIALWLLRRDAIAGGPVRRRWLVALLAAIPPLAVLGLIALVASVPGMTATLRQLAPDTAGQAPPASAAMLASGMLLTVCLAPMAEELFFRGWLWGRLRLYWRPLATAVCTGLLFMLLHLTGGLLKPLFVLPSTVLLTLARHYGGGVRASIIVHIVHNGTIAAMTVLARLA